MISEKQRIIHPQDILKKPEQSFPQCVFITDSSVMAWSFNSMATSEFGQSYQTSLQGNLKQLARAKQIYRQDI